MNATNPPDLSRSDTSSFDPISPLHLYYPRWLDDRDWYMAFLPTRPYYSGELMGSIAYSASTVPLEPAPGGCRIRRDVRESWAQLEEHIHWTTIELLKAAGQAGTLDYIPYRKPSSMNYGMLFPSAAKARKCYEKVKCVFDVHLAKLSWATVTGYNPQTARVVPSAEGPFPLKSIKHWEEELINGQRLPVGWPDNLFRSWVLDESQQRVGCLIDAYRMDSQCFSWGGSISWLVKHAPYVPFWISYGKPPLTQIPHVMFALAQKPSAAEVEASLERGERTGGAQRTSQRLLPGVENPTRRMSEAEIRSWLGNRQEFSKDKTEKASEARRRLVEANAVEFSDPSRIPNGKKDPSVFCWTQVGETDAYQRENVGRRRIADMWTETSPKTRVFVSWFYTFEVLPFLDPDWTPPLVEPHLDNPYDYEDDGDWQRLPLSEEEYSVWIGSHGPTPALNQVASSSSSRSDATRSTSRDSQGTHVGSSVQTLQSGSTSSNSRYVSAKFYHVTVMLTTPQASSRKPRACPAYGIPSAQPKREEFSLSLANAPTTPC